MIGDNPEVDVLGATNAGWNSILVRTGIHESAENDAAHPATRVHENVFDAVKFLISERR